MKLSSQGLRGLFDKHAWSHVALHTNCTIAIPAGPYFISIYTGDIYRAYRLYSGVNGAFTEGVFALPDGNIQLCRHLLKFGIEDIYDVAGTKRGCGNCDYYDLYPEKNASAPAVQRLVYAGAIIIGKLKTSQFVNGEIANADWVDYHSPFHVSGDGYSDQSSSLSGPDAGFEAYSWLDLRLDSDTGGSIRNPAQVNGGYGSRPSHGLVTLDNIMLLSPLLDTSGCMCRDAELWNTAAYCHIIPPKAVHDWFSRECIDRGWRCPAFNFDQAGRLLGVISSVLDYDSMCRASPQAAAANAPTLSDLLALTYPTLISKQQYALLGAPFISDYGTAHDGRYPFLDPNPLVCWKWGHTLEQAITN
ncbi:hypothetical protein BP5796_09144 [Coleophoma crateriformis]|uniref:Amidase domain-containing protein n=1 Tax=Coleophoma crateriformis TaxID=565419 RepID=A0A3D8R383_9HELO|nr:hypothetical protein BP5796_09144 [Coleophoma crateriformis]